jgi:hypothetical protein
MRPKGWPGCGTGSKRPAHCPHETPAEVIEKIIYLRTSYHFGPAKISMYFRRYHNIEISNSGAWQILKRLDLSGEAVKTALCSARTRRAGMRPWLLRCR